MQRLPFLVALLMLSAMVLSACDVLMTPQEVQARYDAQAAQAYAEAAQANSAASAAESHAHAEVMSSLEQTKQLQLLLLANGGSAMWYPVFGCAIAALVLVAGALYARSLGR